MSAFLWSDDPVSVTTPPGKQPLPEVTEEGVGGGYLQTPWWGSRTNTDGEAALPCWRSPPPPSDPRVHPGRALLASPAP